MSEVNRYIKDLSDIGWTGDEPSQGRECIAFTETEDQAQSAVRSMGELLQKKAMEKSMNLETEEDPFGNLYLTLHGKSPKKVIVCSHIDSVHRGGRYDGIAGVASGLDLLGKIIEDGISPEKTIQVISFRAEESSATKMACLGSSLATGQVSINDLQRSRHDIFGKSLLNVLAERGLSAGQIDELISNPWIKGRDIEAVLEVHHEQSGVLETLKSPLGLVIKGIGGALRRKVNISTQGQSVDIPQDAKLLQIKLKGTANHSGGTPMNGEVIADRKFEIRKDALVAMAKMLLQISGKYLTKITVPGGSVNTVPGECVAKFYVPQNAYSGVVDQIRKSPIFNEFEGELNLDRGEQITIAAIQEKVANAAMEVIKEVESVAEKMAVDTNGLVRATVGKVEANREGVIEILIDERRLDNFHGDNLTHTLDKRMKAVEGRRGVSVTEDQSVEDSRKLSLATSFEDERIQQIVRATHLQMFESPIPEFGSMAGHDAAKLCRAGEDGKKLPTAMIFIRGEKGGISHHPSEYSSPEDIAKGSNLLYEVVKKIAF